jgi:hypothetical protein
VFGRPIAIPTANGRLWMPSSSVWVWLFVA